jgi:hypothetical protein
MPGVMIIISRNKNQKSKMKDPKRLSDKMPYQVLFPGVNFDRCSPSILGDSRSGCYRQTDRQIDKQTNKEIASYATVIQDAQSQYEFNQ